MRARAIQDHYNQLSAMRGAYLGKKLVHAFGVHFVAEHPVHLTLSRTDGTVHIRELPLVAVIDDWSQRRGRPATFYPHHASEAGFVLEHEPHAAWLHGLCVEEICQYLREFFFHSSWALGSAFGWRVSGATLRHPWRSNIRYTTVAATG